MVQSEFFGRTFWLGKDNQLKSAPTYVDNTVAYDCADMYQTGQIGRELVILNSLILSLS